MRTVPLIVISDIHLGTRNCQANRLLNYLNNVQPEKIILLGDVFDMIAKDKNFWPESHTHVVRKVLKFAAEGVPVVYVTGNHDAMMRQYSGMHMANVELCDQYDLTLNGHRTLFVHGDIFDVTTGHNFFVRLVGGWSYDALMTVNRQINWTRRMFGLQPFSLAGLIKRNLAQASKYIARYEKHAREHAAEREFDAIVCGHIHQPRLAEDFEAAGVRYHNSGDWTEHGTALEWNGVWTLHWEPWVVTSTASHHKHTAIEQAEEVVTAA